MSLDQEIADKVEYLLSVGYNQDLLEICKDYWKEQGYEDVDSITDDLEDEDGSDIIQHLKEKYNWNDQKSKHFYLKLRQALDIDPKAPSTSTSADSEPKTDSIDPNNHNKKRRKPPLLNEESKESIVVKLLSQNITDKERKRYIEDSKSPLKKRIKATAPLMLTTSTSSGGFKFGGSKKNNNEAQDILHLELLGYKNANYPLLLHFVDSLVRCRMNEWIKNGYTLKDKISANQFLTHYCKHAHFQQFLQSALGQKIQPLISTAIQSYLGRILPAFHMMDPVYKINGDPLELCNYMFEMARIARNAANQPVHNLTTIIPLQIDFLILNGNIKSGIPKKDEAQGIKELFGDDQSDEEDSDDDEDDDEKESIPKDMEQLFKNKKIEYMLYENPLREMLRCTEGIKRIIDNQRCRRTVFVLDRRNNAKKNGVGDGDGMKGDKLYLFKPAKYDKFEENELDLIHESLHYNSIVSIIPRPDKKNHDFAACESLRGQMFVISFHIISKEEIRCYLFYQGQCFRFFGEDLINVLPRLFVDKKQAKETMMNSLKDLKWRNAFDDFCSTFVDERFDRFYYGLTGKGPRFKVH